MKFIKADLKGLKVGHKTAKMELEANKVQITEKQMNELLDEFFITGQDPSEKPLRAQAVKTLLQGYPIVMEFPDGREIRLIKMKEVEGKKGGQS